MKKTITILAMTAILLFSAGPGTFFASAEANNFSDYSSDDWFYKEVNYLVEAGIIKGVGDNKVAPLKSVSRAETAVMFQRAFDLKPTTTKSPFKDVKEKNKSNDWYYDAVIASYEAGIFKGKGDGTFGPTDTLTREQMASVIVRAFDLKPIPNTEVEIADLDQAMGFYQDDIKTLFQHGVAIGDSKTVKTFNPKGTVSRASFATFQYRAIHVDVVEEEVEEDGAGGGAGGGGIVIDGPKASSSSIQLKDSDGNNGGTVYARIRNDGGVNRIEFDLSGYDNKLMIADGQIVITEAGTMVIEGVPEKGTVSDDLSEGSNSLSLAKQNINVSLFEIFKDNKYTFQGSLTNDKGETTPIEIVFKR